MGLLTTRNDCANQACKKGKIRERYMARTGPVWRWKTCTSCKGRGYSVSLRSL